MTVAMMDVEWVVQMVGVWEFVSVAIMAETMVELKVELMAVSMVALKVPKRAALTALTMVRRLAGWMDASLDASMADRTA